MFIQMLLKEKRTAQLYTLIIFLVLAIVFLVITFFLQMSEDRIEKTRIEITEHELVQAEKAAITSKVNMRASDVLFIADTLVLSGEMLHDYAAIERPWIAFSNWYRIFDQIRFIDTDGQERIRINYSPEGAYAVAEDGLQNKADRYYFKNTMTLKDGDVFVSKLDLNIENGQIETPIKPTLRLATPLHLEDGLEGVVILNYAAEDMLAQVRAIASAGAGEFYLLNAGGYYLYNSRDSQHEWAFMYEDRMNESFAAAFPLEWKAIVTGAESGFLNTKNGVFTYTALPLEDAIAGNSENIKVFDNSGSFYIVSYISAASDTGALFSDSFPKALGRVFMKYLSIYFLLTGVAFVLASFVAVGRAQKKEIKYFSEFDALTGVYNRRAGYRKLNDLKKQSTDRDYKISICFIDINGLKEVNDSLGHDMGDELIKTVATLIRDSVRGNDFVSRFGGDEFLIVFDRLDEAGAETVWKRITGRFETINTEENRPYVISVSHGIGAFVSNEEISVDEIVSRADEKMYQEKREMKKGLEVVRGPKE